MDENLVIQSVTINDNTTELDSDAKLVESLSFALFKSFNRKSLELQDLLAHLGQHKQQ